MRFPAVAMGLLLALPLSAQALTGHSGLGRIAQDAEWVASGVVSLSREDGGFVLPLSVSIKGEPPGAYESNPIPNRFDAWRPQLGTPLLAYRLDGRIGYQRCTSPEAVAYAFGRMFRLKSANSAAERTAILQELIASGIPEALTAVWFTTTHDRSLGGLNPEEFDLRALRPALMKVAEDPQNRNAHGAVGMLLHMLRLEDVDELLHLTRLHPKKRGYSIPSDIMEALTYRIGPRVDEPRHLCPKCEPRSVIRPPAEFQVRWKRLAADDPKQFDEAVARWVRWFKGHEKTQLFVKP